MHGLPWAPAPFAGNIFALARYLGGQGWSEQNIRAHLDFHHGHETRLNRQNASRQGANWGTNIANLTAVDPDANIPREWMYFDAASFAAGRRLGSTYRFSVLFEILDPATGAFGYNTVIVDSSRNISINEIIDQARATYASLAQSNPSFQDWDIANEVSAQVTTAQRRSR